MSKLVIIYTDGSCYYKTRDGGVGIFIKIGEEEYFYKYGYSNTTISRMELRAIIIALQKVIDKGLRVKIYSDSEYAIKCVSEERLWRWERSGWVGVKNLDLMKRFLLEIRKFQIRPELIHVRGHQDPMTDDHAQGNLIADFLADYKSFEKRIKDVENDFTTE